MVLMKEYRIPLPLSIEEYRVAQLYMIQKKSRQESTGENSRVEILENRPYENGPGGAGQYTKKIYHIGSHIPSWIKALLPKTALRVEEEAWNAYPYTKTRTTCPFVEKFYIDVETHYCADAGTQDNIFKFSKEQRTNIPVDIIDSIKDPFPSAYYKQDEDPKIYMSEKTKRGPLRDDWLQKYQANDSLQPVMCAYKLITVEFRYWGMQTKIEQYIHEGARRTVLVAHRQAWAWQDEWCDLTMADIRRLELELQQDLFEKAEVQSPKAVHFNEDDNKDNSTEELPDRQKSSPDSAVKRFNRRSLATSLAIGQSTEELILGLRMGSIEKNSDSSSEESDDEFVDALEYQNAEKLSLQLRAVSQGSWSSESTLISLKSNASKEQFTLAPSLIDLRSSRSTLLLVVHGGSAMDLDFELSSKKRDFSTFQTVFTSVAELLYPDAKQNVAIRLIECPPVCPQIIGHLKDISVFCDEKGTESDSTWLPPNFPSSCVPLLLASSQEFQQAVNEVIQKANNIYRNAVGEVRDELMCGKICVLADCIGAMLVYSALCYQNNRNSYDTQSSESLPTNFSSKNNMGLSPGNTSTKFQRSFSIDEPPRVRTDSECQKFEFHITDFFCCGSPIGLIMMKKLIDVGHAFPAKPVCDQVYNIFYPFDPIASRLEPLLDRQFASFRPACIPKYETFPFHTELLYRTQNSNQLSFDDLEADSEVYPGSPSETISAGPPSRKISAADSLSSQGSVIVRDERLLDNVQGWWGSKRIDYMLYCPNGLQQFPFSALTQLCYSSYWESRDMVAFILWQILDDGFYNTAVSVPIGKATFEPQIPKEKWQKKRTALKIKNLHPHHRANDVITVDGASQCITGKFTYGPVEVAALTGEKVDIYVMSHRQMEEWKLVGTSLTDSHGRLNYCVPVEHKVSPGVHSVKMVVRGDHSFIDFNMAVLPPGTEAVVFSIDGSFLAAYSLRGVDPKIRGGAVDVVRHWQELGYLIIYVTSRLLYQKSQVMAWLTQHNFPFGMVSFCESISKDYQKHKLEFLRDLINTEEINIRAVYGSARDISIFKSLGLPKHQIFIVGKPKHRKYATEVEIISEGYANHLSSLATNALSRPASGVSCTLLPRGCFGLPPASRASSSGDLSKSSGFRFPFFRSRSHGKNPSESSTDERRDLVESSGSGSRYATQSMLRNVRTLPKFGSIRS